MLHIHSRLSGTDIAIGLQGAYAQTRAHVGGGVANVDLAAGDVVGAAVERDALVRPVIACLVEVYGAECGRGT